LQSREVRLAVVRDTFRFPDAEQPMTYVDYVNQPTGPLGTVFDYTLFLPWTLKGMIGSMISETPAPAGTTDSGKLLIPNEEENAALKSIADKIAASVDDETGLMTITVTAGGPRLAASLAESFLDHFTTRVRDIRTEKVRERVQFVEGRFEEAEQGLEVAEDRLAQFLEQNQNPTTASLQFRRDRLQRQVSFKEQLYSELQSQLTQTRLDLQRRQPVVTIVEKASIPLNESGTSGVLIVLLSGIIGILLGGGSALLLELVRGHGGGPEEDKVSRLMEEFVPDQLLTRWKSAASQD
jgi:uncharacterized protein involved in exopolysaccharide biosynthesis